MSRIPLGRLEKPSDIAEAVVFFASPTFDYVTGQVMNVDGVWISA
jgi:NAD(P)-dependent dehydrogenase (short-subunit alcohol dehydrogenase family)